ncbi:MerR family transcriptional regulator [Empedobacter sp. GD03739]|uniref:MerR family transcriptional regulator n=1 Tax=Empedobacter sp. GD03739 TaxID=2975376 RepID=UPI0024496A5A|nr:MerR family transcriptional regulator [Empedobacter sp. GD03739]MDH1602110.1 MerR family transcriptional regulator [Empedobacter sp. GD03739]
MEGNQYFMLNQRDLEQLLKDVIIEHFESKFQMLEDYITKPLSTSIATEEQKYTRRQIQDIFGITYQTVINWEKQGDLNALSEFSNGGRIRYFYTYENVKKLSNIKSVKNNHLLSA